MFDTEESETSPDRPPPNVHFLDSIGPVALIGCVPRAGTLAFGGHQTSEGRIVAEYAVLGAEHERFDTINAMRMFSAAVSQWIGLSSTSVELEKGTGGALQGAAIKYKNQQKVRVARSMNLAFDPLWRAHTDPSTGESSGRAYSTVATRVARPRPLVEHLRAIRAVLDLVAVASWEPITVQSVEVFRDDARVRTLDGKGHGDKWLELIQRDLPTGEEPSSRQSFLFEFKDTGTRVIEKWLELQTSFPRVINPLVSLPRMRDTYLENQLLQSSIAVDALGNAIQDAVGNDSDRNGRGQLSYNIALRNVLNDMAWLPISDEAEWIRSSNAAYMGLKHVDRPAVAVPAMVDAHLYNAMILRAWVAQKLGVTEDRFKRNYFHDPIARHLA